MVESLWLVRMSSVHGPPEAYEAYRRESVYCLISSKRGQLGSFSLLHVDIRLTRRLIID